MVMDDDCFSPLTKERIKSECEIEKRGCGRVLAGGEDFVARVLPMNKVTMNQSSMIDGFEPSSSEE
jgi:hypothetical protein